MASQAEIDLIVNASDTLPELTRDLDQIVRQAEAGADDIDLDAAINRSESLAQLQNDLDDLVNRAREGADDIDLQAALNASTAVFRTRTALDDVINTLNSEAQADPVQIRAALNANRALLNIRGPLNRVIRQAENDADDIDVDVDIDTDSAERALRRLLPELDGVGRAAGGAGRALGVMGVGVGALGAAAGTAVPLVASLATAVENLLPAAAVATQGFLAVQLASGTLKLGLLGLEDALEAVFDPDADPEALAEAMERLSDNAQDFVQVVQDLKPAFEDLRLDVQDRLFRNLDDSLSSLTRSVIPQLEGALQSTATTLNAMARSVVDAAVELGANGTLGTALDGATRGLENLGSIPPQLVTAFGQLAAAAAPAFDRITAAAARVADGLSDRLADSFASGGLEDAINRAVDSFAQLGRIAGNTGTILGNVFGTASESAGGLFGALERITGALADATASEGFQRALTALVDTMGVLGQTVAPLFARALEIVGRVIETLAPVAQRLITVLGDQLGGILDAAEEPLIALADAFGKLVVAVLPLIELAGELVVALLPALTPLFETLGRIIEAATPVVQGLADVLGAVLVPIFESLAPILETVLPPFAELAETVLPLLGDILVELAPSLGELAEAFAELLVQLAPLGTVVTELAAAVLDELLPAVGPVIVTAVKLLTETLELLAGLISGTVVESLKGLAALLNGDTVGAVEHFISAAENMKTLVTQAFYNLVSRASAALSDFKGAVKRRADEAAYDLQRSIQDGVNDALDWLRGLPSRAVGALGNLGSTLFNAGASLLQGFLDGIVSKVGAIRSELSTLTNLIPDWKGPAEKDATLLTRSGELIMDSLIDGFENRFPDVQASLGGFTGELAGTTGVSSLRPAVPVVMVTIGNEAVDQYVTARVEAHDDERTRTMAQGVRR